MICLMPARQLADTDHALDVDRADALRQYAPSLKDEYVRRYREMIAAEPRTPCFHLVRVYPNGSAKESYRNYRGVTSWLAYNRKWRPGNALFVNGVCEDRSHFRPEFIAGIEAQLAAQYSYPTDRLAEVCGPQMDFFGGSVHRYWGYGEEPPIRPDFQALATELYRARKLEKADAHPA